MVFFTKMHFSVSLVVILLYVTLIIGKKFPKEFKRCRKADPKMNDCLKDAIQKGLPYAAKGLPHAGLLPVDPLYSPRVQMFQQYGPVVLNVSSINGSAYGFSKSVIQSVRADVNNYSLTIIGLVPLFTIKGVYEVDANILLLPLEGSGTYTIKMENVTGHITIHGSPKTRAGSEYLYVNRVEADINPSKISYDIKNLFNGNKLLGDYANWFLNAFNDKIYRETKYLFQETMGEIYTRVARGFFNVVPYEEIYL